MQFLTKRTLLPFLALGMVATSCQDEDFGFSQQDVKASAYERAFDETFADVDHRVFQGILDNELDLQVNIPGNFTLYITQGFCSGDPACNVLYDLRTGIEGDGNSYVQKFSTPSDVETVYVSLVTENYEVWSKKVAIKDGKCSAVFGEMATTRGASTEWAELWNGEHYAVWTRWENEDHDVILDELEFIIQNYEYFSQLLSAEYLIAWEDLGGTFDFDFNDVVMKVRRDYSDINKFQVEVQVLAAGGTMPIAIGCKAKADAMGGNDPRQLIKFNDKEDLHEAWGVSEVTRVNTVLRSSEPNYNNLKDLFVMDKEPLKATIEMKVTDAKTTTLASVMNQFFLARQNKFYNPNNRDGWDIGAPNYIFGALKSETNKFCHAIVIADCDWEWPEEHNCILDKYPVLKDWKNYIPSQISSNQVSIWTGKDKNSYMIPEGNFEAMLNAQWNLLRTDYSSPYKGNQYSFWYTDRSGENHDVMSMEFTEILDYDKPEHKQYFWDSFEAYARWHESDNYATTTADIWTYDVPFKSRRLFIPYSMVKDYRYRFEGTDPVTSTNPYENEHTIYKPGDEMFVIAIVMVNRPYYEDDALFLSTGSAGPDVEQEPFHDGRSYSAHFKPYEEGKGAVDIYFAEVFLENMRFTELDDNKWWGYATPSEAGTPDREKEDCRWGQLKPDYTIFANIFGEEMVFPYDLMISPFNQYGYVQQTLDENNMIVESTQFQSCVKVPEARFYKVFVGRPSDRSQYKPTPVPSETEGND